MKHYGKQSLFVHALSDLHTLKIARMMQDNCQLEDFSTVKRYVDEQALEAIRALSSCCTSVRKALFQEPLGTAPVGAIESSIDSEYGVGVFSAWLQAFEERDFAKCAASLVTRQ